MKTGIEQAQNVFDERQYIGANKGSLSLRIFLSLVCFVAYYFTPPPRPNSEILFLLGVIILVISVVLLFVTHLRTRVTGQFIHLSTSFGYGKVNIPVQEVISAEKTRYSTFLVNNPVYNLHRKNELRFYTGGKYAVRIKLKSGTSYLVGTQQPEALVHTISTLIPA